MSLTILYQRFKFTTMINNSIFNFELGKLDVQYFNQRPLVDFLLTILLQQTIDARTKAAQRQKQIQGVYIYDMR